MCSCRKAKSWKVQRPKGHLRTNPLPNSNSNPNPNGTLTLDVTKNLIFRWVMSAFWKFDVFNFQAFGRFPEQTGASLLNWLSKLVAQIPGLQRLLSSSTSALSVPLTRLRTIGDRAFPVAAAKAWNSLPAKVTSARSLQTFKSKLKTHLFLSHSCNFLPRPTPLL